jgi:hypothetical protein
MNKRRAQERVTVDIDVKLSRGRVFYYGKIVDISESGMLIKTDESILCGESYNVHILTDKEIPNLIGKVKRLKKEKSTSPDIGVEIISPSQEYKDFVKDLISDQLI